MKYSIQHDTLGLVTYEESFWTGKSQLWVNGELLQKADKKTFVMTRDSKITYIHLTGNIIFGVTMSIDSEKIEIVPKAKWYELALVSLIFILTIVWGNSVQLCSIIPIVGGAIGGAISAIVAITTLISMKRSKPIMKVVIGICGIIVAFLIEYLVALLIIGALA